MVTTINMWDRFMNRPSIECLDLFENEYKRSGDLSDLRNHNLVLMDIGQWQKAKGNCVKIINEEEHAGDGDFIQMGMIEWFLGNTVAAVDFWKQSMDTPYAACPGAPDSPLLLWYAGHRLSDKKLLKQSLNRLKRYWRVQDYRVFSEWMGTVAIAGFLMDKVSVRVFLHKWKEEAAGSLEYRRVCRANFWVGMKCLDRLEDEAITHFRAAFSSNKIAILEYEYFLAKWEYSRLSKDNLSDQNPSG